MPSCDSPLAGQEVENFGHCRPANLECRCRVLCIDCLARQERPAGGTETSIPAAACRLMTLTRSHNQLLARLLHLFSSCWKPSPNKKEKKSSPALSLPVAVIRRSNRGNRHGPNFLSQSLPRHVDITTQIAGNSN